MDDLYDILNNIMVSSKTRTIILVLFSMSEDRMTSTSLTQNVTLFNNALTNSNFTKFIVRLKNYVINHIC
jgi:hypothetical protein